MMHKHQNRGGDTEQRAVKFTPRAQRERRRGPAMIAPSNYLIFVSRVSCFVIFRVPPECVFRGAGVSPPAAGSDTKHAAL